MIAGLGTLVLANVRARADTEESLREQASITAANIALFFDESDEQQLTDDQQQQRLRQLTLLRRVVDLDGFAVLAITATGTLDADQLPDGVETSMLDIASLRQGDVDRRPRRRPRVRRGTVRPPEEPHRCDRAVAGRQCRPRSGGPLLRARRYRVGPPRRARRRRRRPTGHTSDPRRVGGDHPDRRRRAEHPVARPRRAAADDELVELSRHVNEMAETLERSRALEQQFLLSVSHDLRTPLTSIRGYAEAISDGAGDPRRAAAVITSEARRLERLVADLLDLAKLQASSFSLALERDRPRSAGGRGGRGLRARCRRARCLMMRAIRRRSRCRCWPTTTGSPRWQPT